MTSIWNQQSVLALAPDPESVKAGKSLAVKSKWGQLGSHPSALWGECQGSGSKPYQTRIDLSEPAFKCSCPSRKFPCKHSLALFLLFVETPDLFLVGEPPEWVTEWLQSRQERVQKQAEKQEQSSAPLPTDPEAQMQRQANRTAKVNAGLDDLERWMRDLVRTGLATAPSHSYSFWDKPAARLVDAQAPGLARMVRDLAGISSSGTGWPEHLLARLGKIQLVVDGFRRIDTLPPSVQADIRTLIGFPVAKEDVLREPHVRDRWLVLASTLEEDTDGMSVHRAWLWGRETKRPAMLLTFAHRSQRLETVGEAVAGTTMTADLAFYPGSAPMRALLVERRSAIDPMTEFPGTSHISEAMRPWQAALAAKPWLESFPLILDGVHFYPSGDRWMVRDATGHALLISKRFARPWHLMAAAGGEQLALFGLWNGADFLPLSGWTSLGYISLSQQGTN